MTFRPIDLEEPPHSCPKLDAAIGAATGHDCQADVERFVEEARGIHMELRSWGHAWKEEAERLDVECDTLREELDELRSELTEAEREIRRLAAGNTETR